MTPGEWEETVFVGGPLDGRKGKATPAEQRVGYRVWARDEDIEIIAHMYEMTGRRNADYALIWAYRGEGAVDPPVYLDQFCRPIPQRDELDP